MKLRSVPRRSLWEAWAAAAAVLLLLLLHPRAGVAAAAAASEEQQQQDAAFAQYQAIPSDVSERGLRERALLCVGTFVCGRCSVGSANVSRLVARAAQTPPRAAASSARNTSSVAHMHNPSPLSAETYSDLEARTGRESWLQRLLGADCYTRAVGVRHAAAPHPPRMPFCSSSSSALALPSFPATVPQTQICCRPRHLVAHPHPPPCAPQHGRKQKQELKGGDCHRMDELSRAWLAVAFTECHQALVRGAPLACRRGGKAALEVCRTRARG